MNSFFCRSVLFLIVFFFSFQLDTFVNNKCCHAMPDGYMFVNYTNRNYINDIAIEGDYIWLATAGGVLKRDKNGKLIASYTTIDGLVSNYIESIAIDNDGNKWFATTDGVSKFDGTNWTTHLIVDSSHSHRVREIIIDNDGNKWLGTDINGVLKFNGTNWTKYTTVDGLVSNTVFSIAIDNDDNKWFGTIGGVSKFDGSDWTTYTTTDGLAIDHVNSIAIDNDGNKWFGTDNGISKFDGTNWTTYTKNDGLSSNYISSGVIKISHFEESKLRTLPFPPER